MSKQVGAIRPENAELAEKIIGQMKAGADRWEMPWHKGINEAVNALTGRVFTGYNATILWQQGLARNYTSNKWATLKQWRKFKGMVRAGAKSVTIYQPLIRKQHDKYGGIKEIVYAYKRYHVFNYDEINNVNFEHPDLFSSANSNPFEFNETAELIASKSKAIIKHGNIDAFYSPSLDYIGMPHQRNFFATEIASASENYYSTLLHELIHWTKQIGRSPREYNFYDQEKDYAFEELVAELGASILITRVDGLVCPRRDHAAYLKSWLSILEEDFEQFYKAMYLAQKASDWLCDQAGLDVNRYGWYVEGANQCLEDDEVVTVVDQPELAASVRKPAYSKPPKKDYVTAVKYYHHWSVGSFNWLVRTDITCAKCSYEYSVVIKLNERSSSCPSCSVYNCFGSVNDLYFT